MSTKNKELKIGDKVSGKSLNGKEITGELVIIPRHDPSIGHVLVEKGQLAIPAKLEDLKPAEPPAGKSAKPSPSS